MANLAAPSMDYSGVLVRCAGRGRSHRVRCSGRLWSGDSMRRRACVSKCLCPVAPRPTGSEERGETAAGRGCRCVRKFYKGTLLCTSMLKQRI